ncbi:uncharacterized protein FIBRA_03479 [Fibroporia radiculosa]|uniref:Histone-lysine N-methyltransferase, H3 lysine-79 specific n=1 Tax=Fibroporia radiculosa TaxID=599839 RepID=J4G5M1_9APHY|nr:uncharacterized protein FIBRA_03479 [Fibroporia radiculosa]CCM01428.1 predicted protein [Fibroporia radiculosa]
MAAPRHSSSDLGFFSKSKFAKSGASSTTSVAVTTRVVAVERIIPKPPGALKLAARPSTPLIAAASSGLNSSNKRKIEPPDVLPGNATKKPRVSTPSGERREASLEPRASLSTRSPASSRHSSRQPSAARSSMHPQPEAESRSRSTSVFPTEAPLSRDCWIGKAYRPGPNFFSSESVVRSLMKTYKTYFSNPSDPNDRTFEAHPTEYPVIELEYPNSGACERFILLVPKDKDHYNPIMCLETSLHTIIRCKKPFMSLHALLLSGITGYLTPAQQSLFGTLPSTSLVNDDPPGPLSAVPLLSISEVVDASSPSVSVLSSAPSPASSSSDSSLTSLSSSSTSLSAVSTSSTSSASSVSSLSSISMLSSLAEFSPPGSQPSASIQPSVNYLRLLQRAINKKDGPLFLKVMAAINTLLRLLKHPPLPVDPFEPLSSNCLSEATRSWTNIPKDVVTRIIDETYQRAVGPHVAELKRYEAFSSEVYGELMPSLIAQIIQTTGLKEDSLFVDLGSGVGNVVLQASLQTGCRSFGIEIMPTPAKIARSQLEQLRMRCQMWGVPMGEVDLEEGDMLKSKKVDDLVPKADVVLVNNKVFLEALNEALRPKFLDLKEGAIVVSLKPFVSSSRLTERNLDDISAIFKVTERHYSTGSVSWGSGGGSYFIHRVDRESYADIKQKLETSRTTLTRSTRSRR